MAFSLTGTIKEIYPEQQITDRFKKREFVVEFKETPSSQFTEFVKLQANNNNTDLLNNFTIGSEVEVFFNITGKPYEKDGKTMYFTNLVAWKINQKGAEQTQTAPTPTAAGHTATPATPEPAGDLPF